MRDRTFFPEGIGDAEYRNHLDLRKDPLLWTNLPPWNDRTTEYRKGRLRIGNTAQFDEPVRPWQNIVVRQHYQIAFYTRQSCIQSGVLPFSGFEKIGERQTIEVR